jgi:hypothetical protein
MAVDVSRLSFDSAFRYERIAIKSSIGFSVAAFGIKLLTIPHNLGYIPYVKSYYTYDDGKYFDLFSGITSYAIDGNGGQIDTAYADTTNYYVQISEQNGSPISGTVYYRIYAEPQT